MGPRNRPAWLSPEERGLSVRKAAAKQTAWLGGGDDPSPPPPPPPPRTGLESHVDRQDGGIGMVGRGRQAGKAAAAACEERCCCLLTSCNVLLLLLLLSPSLVAAVVPGRGEGAQHCETEEGEEEEWGERGGEGKVLKVHPEEFPSDQKSAVLLESRCSDCLPRKEAGKKICRWIEHVLRSDSS